MAAAVSMIVSASTAARLAVPTRPPAPRRALASVRTGNAPGNVNVA